MEHGTEGAVPVTKYSFFNPQVSENASFGTVLMPNSSLEACWLPVAPLVDGWFSSIDPFSGVLGIGSKAEPLVSVANDCCHSGRVLQSRYRENVYGK